MLPDTPVSLLNRGKPEKARQARLGDSLKLLLLQPPALQNQPCRNLMLAWCCTVMVLRPTAMVTPSAFISEPVESAGDVKIAA